MVPASKRVPLSPQQGWLGDGRRVLQFLPGRYSRWSQVLELIVGELLCGQPAPLLSLWFEVHEPAMGTKRFPAGQGVDYADARVISI
jgi:hypothetical protein